MRATPRFSYTTSLMRIVLNLPGATRQHADGVAAALRMLTGIQPVVLPDEEPPSTRLQKRASDTSRFVLANILGCHLATFDAREAAMVITLLERGASGFTTAEELNAVLQGWPAWRGQRHLVVPTYRRLRESLSATRYRLRGRGYGFDSDEASSSVSVLAV